MHAGDAQRRLDQMHSLCEAMTKSVESCVTSRAGCITRRGNICAVCCLRDCSSEWNEVNKTKVWGRTVPCLYTCRQASAGLQIPGPTYHRWSLEPLLDSTLYWSDATLHRIIRATLAIGWYYLSIRKEQRVLMRWCIWCTDGIGVSCR